MDLSAVLADPVLSAVIGGAASLATTKLIGALRVAPYLSLIQKVFTVVDPVLNDNIQNYTASDVRFAIALAVSVLADGNINPGEVGFVISEVQRRWFPTIAAGKTIQQLPVSSVQRVIAENIAKAVADGARFNSAGLPPTTLINAIRNQV